MSQARAFDRTKIEAIRACGPALFSQFPAVWKRGREFVAACPNHADKTPSLTIYRHRDGAWMWHCFPCSKSGDVFTLLRLQGVGFNQALERLADEAKLVWNLQSEPAPYHPNGRAGSAGRRGKIATLYNYDDEHRRLLYQVVRMEPKDFRQRKPDGRGGWIWRLEGVRRVLYRLPQLLHRPEDTVYVVEGEKDADRLANAGLVATSNVGGAGGWRLPYSQSLKGRRVVILPDNDDAGRKHAASVLASLRGIARSVRIHELPDLPPKGDASDWLNAGGRAADLPKE
jgi:DNA primase